MYTSVEEMGLQVGGSARRQARAKSGGLVYRNMQEENSASWAYESEVKAQETALVTWYLSAVLADGPLSVLVTGLLCPWNPPGKNAGVNCHFLLQGIFPTQGLDSGLLHCKQILYHLNYY